MTNNFEFIEKYMIQEGIPMHMKDMGDLFFCVILVRRGKDHPDLPAANYMFKTYYIDSIEQLNFFKEEIITCCDIFKLRAYVSVNIKSKEQITKKVSFKYAQNILNNEYKKPWRVMDHVFSGLGAVNDKAWLLDIDEEYFEIPGYASRIKEMIEQCKSKYDKICLAEIPTRSGIHLLTRPFNLNDFEKLHNKEFDIPIPDIKRNHITLLYENI